MGEPSYPALPTAPLCPFCDGRDTELVSPFGGQLAVAQYWCRRCRTGFDYLKGDRTRLGDQAEPAGESE